MLEVKNTNQFQGYRQRSLKINSYCTSSIFCKTDGQTSVKGFTLIEVIVVIAILAILAGAMAPLMYKQINLARDDVAKDELEDIYKTIRGDPEKGIYGFLGDIGRIPSGSNLRELVVNFNNLPAYQQGTNGISRGWNGSYLDNPRYNPSDTSMIPRDPWGNPYRLGTNGQVISDGADGNAGTSDDITYPFTTPSSINNNVAITVQSKDPTNPSIVNTLNGNTASVTLYYFQNGLELTQALLWSTINNYFYANTSVPKGLHAIIVAGLNGPLPDPDGPGPNPDPDDYSSKNGRTNIEVENSIVPTTIFIN